MANPNPRVRKKPASGLQASDPLDNNNHPTSTRTQGEQQTAQQQTGYDPVNVFVFLTHLLSPRPVAQKMKRVLCVLGHLPLLSHIWTFFWSREELLLLLLVQLVEGALILTRRGSKQAEGRQLVCALFRREYNRDPKSLDGSSGIRMQMEGGFCVFIAVF